MHPRLSRNKMQGGPWCEMGVKQNMAASSLRLVSGRPGNAQNPRMPSQTLGTGFIASRCASLRSMRAQKRGMTVRPAGCCSVSQRRGQCRRPGCVMRRIHSCSGGTVSTSSARAFVNPQDPAPQLTCAATHSSYCELPP